MSKHSGTFQIYAIPFAGADKFCYRNIVKACTDVPESDIVFNVFELPGRGSRNKELLLTDIPSMAMDLFETIKLTGWPRQYAIFGHSMGALLAHQVLILARDQGCALPVFAYFTSCQAPGYRSKSNFSTLSGKDFWISMKVYNGTPEALIENESLRNYFEPILKSDIHAVENYHTNVKQFLKIQTDLYFRWGMDEHFSLESVMRWQDFFEGKSDFSCREGDHFFIFKTAHAMVSELNSIAQSYARL